MKIQGLHVSNFLSFGPDPDGFNLQGLSDNLTVIVGPNGAGKSNVFRAIRVILDSLDWNADGSRSVDVTGKFFRPLTDTRESMITMDVTFDELWERDLITTFFRCSFLYPEEAQMNGASGPTSVYQRWVQEHVEDSNLDEFLSGSIKILLHRGDPYVREVRFVFLDGTLEVSLLTGNGEIRVLDSGIRRNKSLASAFIGGMLQDSKFEFNSIVNRIDSEFLNIPSFTAEQLKNVIEFEDIVVKTEIAQSNNPMPGELERLYLLMGRVPNHQQKFSLSHVYKCLVTNGVAHFDNWYIPNEIALTYDYQPLKSLKKGELALHLFRLKNGSQDERCTFLKIQDEFRETSGSSVNVIMRYVQETQADRQIRQVQQVQLVGDDDIPLSYCGSGRVQLAMLITLKHLKQGVLLLDEPDVFLHPSIQSQLMRSWKADGAQSIIVTHSPYLIPVGGLEHIRRVYRSSLQGSQSSHPLSNEEIEKFEIRRRVKRVDEVLFLFAKCAVFVEGYDEQIALPIWFEKWVGSYGDRKGETCESLGIRFQAAEGKKNIMPLVDIAKIYAIEWAVLFDADIMSSNKKNGDDNKTIIEQIVRANEVEPGVLVLGEEKSIQEYPVGVQGNIFLRGQHLDDRWETLAEYKRFMVEHENAQGLGKMISRYMAEKYPCPEEFHAFFQKIYEFATGAPV